MVETVVGGLLRASYLIPLALAFSLVARHGSYLPLWLPQCGTLSAYLAFYLGERLGWAPTASAILAIGAVTIFGERLHHIAFSQHVARTEPYPALLLGLAVVVIAENSVALLTKGYTFAFERLRPAWKEFIGWPFNSQIRIWDLLSVGALLVLAPLLWVAINRTRLGLAYRATASNRGLAKEYGLPVEVVDWLVISISALLTAVAGIVYGLRYGLAPQMMTSPTLKVVAVVVAVGERRILLVPLTMLLLGALEAYCQSRPSLSSFEHGASYVLLAAALIMRHSATSAWRRFRPTKAAA